ncbi:MAG: hypothetical protein IKM58_04380 [Tidjanibacter sp.]|nr:hypothetical protein [Tidjanibacter sp.]
MTRELMTSAIREAVEELGYSFHTGTEIQIAGEVTSFPALWMYPLRITAVHGHRDCRVTYRVRLKFITLGGFVRISNEALWQIIESDALALYHSLADHSNIITVDNFKCSPSATFATKSGDISADVEFDIETYYCI